MKREPKRIGILTGGGDVPPLNALIFSARNKALSSQHEFIGFKNGWQGVLEKDFIFLKNIQNFSQVGGTLLKSSRINLLREPDGINKANEVLKELNIEGLIIVGGDDTLSNAYYITDIPYVLISKTIDNDVGKNSDSNVDFNPENVINYFTLGYPSAVNRIVSYVSLEEGIRTTAFSHERIMILESMGMHAGWLALASGLGDPDFIIIPEYPLDYERLCKNIVELYKIQKHVILVISEGVSLKNSDFININAEETDDFGNPRFGGCSYVLRDMLKRDLRTFFNTRNINAVNPSYLYRSGKPSALDFETAKKMGDLAVELLTKQLVSEPVLLTTFFKDGEINVKPIPLSLFPQTDKERFPKRYIDQRFYSPENFNITSVGKKYFRPLMNNSLQLEKSICKKEYYGIY